MQSFEEFKQTAAVEHAKGDKIIEHIGESVELLVKTVDIATGIYFLAKLEAVYSTLLDNMARDLPHLANRIMMAREVHKIMGEEQS